jgi:hypothetical protein
MDTWLSQTFGLFVHFFGRETLNETYVLIALCILLGALALSRISTGLGAIGAFYTTGVILVPLGLALLVAALALPPVFGLDACWMPLAMAGLVFLIVVLPLTILFQKGGYVTALIAWTVTLLVVGAVLTLEPAVRHSADKYIEKGIEIEKHRIATEKYK